MIGAALAVVIQAGLLSVFLLYQKTSIPAGSDPGGNGSGISVSLLGQAAPAGSKKSATARLPATTIARPPKPLSDTIVSGDTAGSPAGNDGASGGIDLGGGSSAASNFQHQLLNHIENYRRYPMEARQNQQEGSVELLFAMDRNGFVLGVWVKKTSGSLVLDREAVATVLRAQPMPTIPDALPAPLNITLPMVFTLNQ
jgi:TonB family C-terminal domain